jgi:hypothetical protein
MPRYEWIQRQHGGRRLDQWITVETGPDGSHAAAIKKEGPWADHGRELPHFQLTLDGHDLGIYDSFADAKQAAEDPSSARPLGRLGDDADKPGPVVGVTEAEEIDAEGDGLWPPL